LRLLTALAAGIGAGSFFDCNLTFCLILLLFLLLILIFIHRNFSYRLSPFFGIGVLLVFFTTGYITARVSNKPPVFYSNGNFSATILEIPLERPGYCQSLIKTDAFYRNDTLFRTNEKMIARFSESDGCSDLIPGRRIFFSRSPEEIIVNRNPYEFDYKKYLERRDIYRQVYLTPESWQPASMPLTRSPSIVAERVRMRLIKIYMDQIRGREELAVLSALTLGYKRGLDTDTKEVFSSAGAMHVLAVSGLHTGIVFMVLSFCFGFLKKRQPGKILYFIIVSVSLWFYAFLTGLSPSVSRAAMMLTFVITGEALSRRADIYNILAASAFFLLLINPDNLFDAGFQLSYSAVFGIVFLQPRLAGLISVRYRPLRYLWMLFTVSLAAQVTTFPLSVFYFSQFPVYFWISGLIVIPVVTILAPMGFLLLIFHNIPDVVRMLTWITENLTVSLISVLKAIDRLPFSVVDLSFTQTETILCIILVLSLFALTATRRFVFIRLILITILLIISSSLTIKISRLCKREIIVYNNPGNSVIHLIKGESNYVIAADLPEPDSYTLNMIMNTVNAMRIKDPLFLKADDSYKDEYLWLRRGIICFDNRIFHLNKVAEEMPGGITPEIVIGYIPERGIFPKDAEILFVTEGNGSGTEVPKGYKVHCLSLTGAYREKW